MSVDISVECRPTLDRYIDWYPANTSPTLHRYFTEYRSSTGRTKSFRYVGRYIGRTDSQSRYCCKVRGHQLSVWAHAHTKNWSAISTYHPPTIDQLATEFERLSTDCQPRDLGQHMPDICATVHRYVTDILPILDLDVSAQYRPTVGRCINRTLTDYRPAIDRVLTDYRPIYPPT